ncbi:SPW repeat domain-containing protein [Rhodococcus daqingensis]|uniref:SPW repeat-containing integral membrane domain-containing protein n=1 Tax=Rhodococcus daqingensis TaxID=2479363 RepID=A0ABW2RVE0_9NOCA
MSDSEHVREVRRDMIVVVTGVALVLLSMWVPVQGDRQITGSILILGLLAYSAGLWAMSTESRSSHWGLIALGLFLLATPLAMNFPNGTTTAATVAVVAGAIITVAGALGLAAGQQGRLPLTRARQRA